ncbi:MULTISPECIES: SSI family serine proteinase inhibitor [unclassified Streptomyces]|uniref:SSI family serine proteinase inhibitor n=1 Tax=unclassified Streptomyces TaxID=2593676 RepID=UPI0004C7105B|nr:MULTISPECIES: SSI family serine proteinase inhibitor [unclassified Streptomyces]
MPVHHRGRTARAAVPAAVAATVSAVLAGAFCAAPAGATEPPPPAGQGLLLTVSGDHDTWIRGVRLSCPDIYGRHPHAAAACDALTWARGDLDALPGEPHACTRQYDPVTVSATGTWRGGPVNWRKEFPNACTLDSATGPVFRF